MALSELKSILKAFGGAEPSAEEKKELVRETLLMTLARAVAADTSLSAIEVETVRRIICRELDDDVSAADVRVAASSELFESQPLEKYLAKVGPQLAADDRLMIMSSLSEVIRSDMRVSPFEVSFFNMVAEALNMSPADLAGLQTTD